MRRLRGRGIDAAHQLSTGGLARLRHVAAEQMARLRHAAAEQMVWLDPDPFFLQDRLSLLVGQDDRVAREVAAQDG
jgi:hypothetical protein